MSIWLLMVVIGGLTYSIRSSLVLSSGRIRLPDVLERGLRYVPSAVLTALILPQFLAPDGELSVSLANPRLVAGMIAAIVAGWTKNMLATIASGMAALWLIQYILRG